MSIEITDNVVERAASIVKALKLIDMPGMDEVAVKLNMQPTHGEIATGKLWAEAFERAYLGQDKKSFDHAMEMRRDRRK